MEAGQRHNQIILPNDDIISYADITWENDRLPMVNMSHKQQGANANGAE
jgi:hypothetical protein